MQDMERLSSLSKDYNELKGSSGGIDKDTLIGGASFLVGLTYVRDLSSCFGVA